MEKLQAIFGERWLLTADAGYTDAPFAQAVTAQGGAYVLALKKNMKVVLEYAQFAFKFPAADITQDTEHRSGEIWTRTLRTQNVLPDEVLAAFPTARTLIERTHQIRRHDGEVVVEQRYAVSSLAASAVEFENIWRRHWAPSRTAVTTAGMRSSVKTPAVPDVRAVCSRRYGMSP